MIKLNTATGNSLPLRKFTYTHICVCVFVNLGRRLEKNRGLASHEFLEDARRLVTRCPWKRLLQYSEWFQ